MHNWFECKVKYQKLDEATGKDKSVKEAYLIDAVSFTEAESRTYKLLEEELNTDFVVTNIAPAKIHEIFPDEDGEIWYKCKVIYIDADENSGKERKTTNFILVYANNIKDAFTRLEEGLSTLLIPWECASIAETKLIDIFPYSPEESVEKQVEGMTPLANLDENSELKNFENELNQDQIDDEIEEAK